MFYSLERVHSEGNVHARAIREEGSQGCLLKQPEDQDLVPETHKGNNQDSVFVEFKPENSWILTAWCQDSKLQLTGDQG